MIRALRLASIATCLAVVGPRRLAQDAPVERLQVRVTSATAGSVYVGAGREAGVLEDDRLVLYPAAGQTLELRIDVVSRSSARARLPAGADPVPVGTLGDVLLPVERLAPPAPADEPLPGGDPAGQVAEPAPPALPEPPPWTRPPEEWAAELPLLASPAGGGSSEPRPEVRGRVYTAGDATWDRIGPGRRYALLRTGVDLRVESPFHRSGELRFDGEFFHRFAGLEDEPDDESNLLRVDRLYYGQGGAPAARSRWAVGRFLQRTLPEFGVLDGVEYGRRIGSRHFVGGSVGFLPNPYDDFRSGDDFQAALLYELSLGQLNELTVAGGYQKSWHQGTPDRDLVVVRAEYAPTSRLRFFGSAWLDYYDSRDLLKEDGFELTELHASGSYRWGSGGGLGLVLTDYRQPEVKRFLGSELDPDVVLGSRVTRASVNAWQDLTDRFRLSGRVDAWEDEQDSGDGGELRLDVRSVFLQQDAIAIAVFGNEGKLSSVAGGRLSASLATPAGSWRATYELADHDDVGLSAPAGNLRQQLIRASWDRLIGRVWSLSLYADARFGDEQDSTSAGFLLQRRL